MAPSLDLVLIDSSTPAPRPRSPMQDDPEISDLEFRAEFGQVLAYLCYRGFDWHTAEEAAAEALTEAWEKGIRPKRYRAAWTRTAGMHAAIRIVKNNPSVRLKAKAYKPPGADQDGTEWHRMFEQHSVLINAMHQLSEKERAVMALHLNDLSVKEIAEELKISRRTACARLARAREQLRSFIETNEREGAK
jgi:RNA polymerase sigma factor (sigma-70 family)